MKKGGVIFGGIFFLAGLGFFYVAVLSQLIDAWNMQSWQAVNGLLVSSNVSSYQSRNDNGSYTTMYKLEAVFNYQVAGDKYRGDRVGINTSSSSDREDAYELMSKLKQDQRQHQSITVWYNPELPSESVYDRSLNWKLLLIMTSFTSIFILVGAGIIAFSWSGSKEDLEVRNADPEKPWTTYQPWASATIYSQAKSNLKLAWFLTALATLFFGTFSLAMFGEHPVATVFSFLFLIIPSLVGKRAIRIQREWDRFQKVPLTLNPYPSVIGGSMGGNLIVPARFKSGDQYSLNLVCTKHWTTRSGNETKSHQSIVWSKQQTAIIKQYGSGTKVQILFDVPADQTPSSKPDNHYHCWTLEVKGNLEGINFHRTYEVPVFVTKDSQTVKEELKENPLNISQKQAIKKRLAVSTVGDQIKLETPGSKAGLAFAGMGGLFSIIGIVIATLNTAFFGVVFALFGSLFFVAGLWIWGRKCKVLVTPKGCDVQVYWFFKKVKHHKIDVADISAIETLRSSGGSVNGKDMGDTFNLVIKYLQYSSLNIGGDFKSTKNATHMKLELERVLNIESA